MTEIIKQSAADSWKNVDFFLRIHGHLPDETCGATFPFGDCEYSPLENKDPINALNERVAELRKDPEYVKLEKQVENAQSKNLNPPKRKD